MAKVVAFDLDGTLTVESETQRGDLAGTWTYRRPRPEMRALMRRAIEQGWTVVVYTARAEEFRRMTENWLHMHSFEFHFLIMGKAYYTWLIDDRATSTEGFRRVLDIERCKDAEADNDDRSQEAI